MYPNRKTAYVLIAIIFMAGAGCKKFLDQDPISTITDETTWQSDADANSAIAACYSLIRSALNSACSFYSYGDLPTDFYGNVLDADYKDIWEVDWSETVSSLNTYDPKLKLRVYTPYYSAIQQSNRCLYFLNKMKLSAFDGESDAEKEARRQKYMAEARFTRAFNYFYMARVWGDVPLDTSYQSDISGITGVARTAQNEVLNCAIADLDTASKYLGWKDESSTDRVVRADKGAVFALLAHIYAWKGVYDSCKAACDSVINSGSYSLVARSNYPDIYKGQSDEGIFEIAQDRTDESMIATQYSASVAYYNLAAPYLPSITTPNWQIDGNVLFQLYSDTTNDIRYSKEFTSLISGSQTYYSCIKYSNITTETANSVDYYLLLNNIIIFRLADIYLLRAEAYAASSTPDYNSALGDINKIRERAGISDMNLSAVSSRNALLDSVTAERGRELFLEGSRFYDLVRNERITGVSQFPYISHNQFLAGKYYWPLDPTLFITNSLLTQTSYWKSLLSN